MYAAVAGGGNYIVVLSAGRLLRRNFIVKLKKSIAKPKKVLKPIERLSKGGDTGVIKKTWMMLLQHPNLPVLLSLHMLLLKLPDVIFAGKRALLLAIFPVERMETGDGISIWADFKQEVPVIRKNPVIKGRVRQIKGSFAWIPHEFLRRGFWASLNHHELLLYLFLVLVADRQGVSYYSFDKICSLISITPDEYIEARNGLTGKNLIAFDGHLFQVLSLPEELVSSLKKPLISEEDMEQADPATIHQLIIRSLNNEG